MASKTSLREVFKEEVVLAIRTSFEGNKRDGQCRCAVRGALDVFEQMRTKLPSSPSDEDKREVLAQIKRKFEVFKLSQQAPQLDAGPADWAIGAIDQLGQKYLPSTPAASGAGGWGSFAWQGAKGIVGAAKNAGNLVWQTFAVPDSKQEEKTPVIPNVRSTPHSSSATQQTATENQQQQKQQAGRTYQVKRVVEDLQNAVSRNWKGSPSLLEKSKETVADWFPGDEISEEDLFEKLNKVFQETENKYVKNAAGDILAKYRRTPQDPVQNTKKSSSSQPASPDPVDEKKESGWQEPAFNRTHAPRYAQEYQKCLVTNPDRGAAAKLNGEIYPQTSEDIAARRYIDSDEFDKMMQETVRYGDKGTPLQPIGPHDRTRSKQAIVQVVNMDSLDAAEQLIGQGYQAPAVLDMANELDIGGKPGRLAKDGSFSTGASTQEEVIFRRTTVAPALEQFADPENPAKYAVPLGDDVMYAPHVQCFRRGPMQGYAYCKPFTVAILACAAINCNQEHRGCNYPLDAEGNRDVTQYVATTRKRIDNILRTAYRNGHDAIVLGAFGCGAFKNEPEEIADYLQKAIEKYRGFFKNITVAVIDMGGSSNLATFSTKIH